jgi:hypothetical protein
MYHDTPSNDIRHPVFHNADMCVKQSFVIEVEL